MTGDDPTDLLLKSTVSHAQNKVRLTFDVGHGLFSSSVVDRGSRLLLRTLATAGWVDKPGRILDVGCGYGPIGLTLGAINPDAEVVLTDRDRRAVAYARHNAALNRVDVERIEPSLGYDAVANDPARPAFDLVACNVPAKAGERAISSILLDAAHVLRPEGRAAVVVIDRIAPLADRTLTESGAEVHLRRTGSGYTVLHYTPAKIDTPYVGGLERGLYDRTNGDHTIGATGYRMQTVWGLPEFDGLGHGTELAGRLVLETRGRHCLFLNPGQGHLAALLRAARPKADILLNGRDLLAVANTDRNCRPSMVIPGDGVRAKDAEGVELAVYAIEPEEPVAVTANALGPLSAVPHVVVHGTSTQISRLTATLRWREDRRLKNRGFSAVRYRRR